MRMGSMRYCLHVERPVDVRKQLTSAGQILIANLRPDPSWIDPEQYSVPAPKKMSLSDIHKLVSFSAMDEAIAS
jgi:hypothetical protein